MTGGCTEKPDGPNHLSFEIVSDRRLKSPERPDGPNHLSFEIVSDRRLKAERPAMLVPHEQELTTIIQAFVTEQYMSRYWHSAIHKYRDSAQYMKTWNKVHVDPTKRGNPNGGESENTRLNHRKAEKSGIHGTRARAIK